MKHILHYIFRRLKPYLINRSYGLPGTAAAKSRQSCPTLCDPIDGSPPGSRPWDSPGKNTGVGYHFLLQCMKVKSESEVAQLCPTLRDPKDCILPGSSAHGIFQTRVLEWVAISFSKCGILLLTTAWMNLTDRVECRNLMRVKNRKTDPW